MADRAIGDRINMEDSTREKKRKGKGKGKRRKENRVEGDGGICRMSIVGFGKEGSHVVIGKIHL